MKCPYCSSEEDKVLDSRPAQDGNAIRRRRECLKCGRRFTTYEYVERMPLMVIKRDGRHEPYDRQKVVNGIVLACRKRPVGRQEIERVVEAVEARLEEQGKLEVSSTEIGEMVLEQLIKIDPVAYVRFASVYRQFNSPEQFVEELKKLEREEQGGRTK
uniref:Transcriptional repressor NrdR n=1 Tax=candidate division WOR-3 bacterium TaxID=2052148 RepID=A0A7V3PT88_UNCW3